MLHFELPEEVKEQIFLILKDIQMFTLSHLSTYSGGHLSIDTLYLHSVTKKLSMVRTTV